VVRHYNHDGRVQEFDFAKLPVTAPMQASLAALFAARCTPDRWAQHTTSKGAWRRLQKFAEFLAGQQQAPSDLHELTPGLVRAWREHSRRTAAGRMAFATVCSMLRDDPRLQSGPVADELARRVIMAPSSAQSYSQAEFSQYTAAARRAFRAALRRIGDNAMHLERWRDGEFAAGSKDWTLGEALDVLARTGNLPVYTDKNGKAYLTLRYRKALGGTRSGAGTWQRLFLTRREAAALGVLLLGEFGWNLSVIDSLEVPVASPDQGEDGRPTYRVTLEKRRRGPGRHYETRNVTDHGADSPGRLITQALEATRFARAVVEELAPGTSRLLVWRAATERFQRKDLDRDPPAGPFRFGMGTSDAQDWARSEGLAGSPFQRGRRTVIALDRREPAQHSQDTHYRRYVLPDHRVQEESVDVIAAGAEDAADRAGKAVLAAQIRERPDPGDAETATADCSSYEDSPWPSPDGGCGASFLTCLACPNARVHPGHHPRLAHLHEALASLRSVLPPGAWAADWRDAHDRLEDLRRQLGAGVWAQALARVTGTDRQLISHLLTGDLHQ
jgi:hypothetical protein